MNDLVRAELKSLMGTTALSAADKLRLQQHFDSIRDAEVKLVWEPAWDPSKMSDEARLELGML